MSRGSPPALRRFLIALLIVYTAKQIVIALVTPPFTGHDEVAHFAGVRIVATEYRMPTLWTDALPSDLARYRPFTIEWHDAEWSPLYTAIHPPLYYVLMAPIYRAAARLPPETIQYVLRCAAIPFGVTIVILSSLMTRALYPRDAFLNVTVPTVVAFQPQVSYEAAMVNNDALATVVYTLVLYRLILMIRDGSSHSRAAEIGALAGIGLLAKGTTVMSLVLIPPAFWMARRGATRRALATQIALALGVALTIVAPWWWFMTRTYGDPMAIEAIARTQPDLTRSDETFLHLLVSGRFLVERWTETWGEFGWRLIHIRPALTALLGVAAAACLAGLALSSVADREIAPGSRWRTFALVLLAGACALSYLSVVQFGVRFVLTQARYYFPVVDAAALLLMVGLRAWIPAAWRTAAQTVVVCSAIAVNATIYTSHVVPYWYFR